MNASLLSIATVTLVYITCCCSSSHSASLTLTAPTASNITIDLLANKGKQQHPSPPAANEGDEDTPNINVNVSSGDDELFHGFSSEEIEKNRIITLHSDGSETISTDEEVIETLEYVRKNKDTHFLYDEPHFITNVEEKRNVIGTDNRYHWNHNRSPHSAIGYLRPDGCTAYLVGPRHLITAAHCVHAGSNTAAIYRPNQVTFHLRRNCRSYGVRYRVSQILTYSNYRNSGDNDYDIACLLLSSTVTNWMGYAYRDPMCIVSGEICGYPDDVNRDSAGRLCTYRPFLCSRCSDIKRLRTGWWNWGTNSNRLQYTCDTEGGMSGSPVVTEDHDSTSALYSYGVHTHGGSSKNKGVRITKKYFHDICRWKCNTGARCAAEC